VEIWNVLSFIEGLPMHLIIIDCRGICKVMKGKDHKNSFDLGRINGTQTNFLK
jgi:hypothetical protein